MTQYTCIHKNASPQLATNDLKYASMNIETPWLSSEQGESCATAGGDPAIVGRWGSRETATSVTWGSGERRRSFNGDGHRRWCAAAPQPAGTPFRPAVAACRGSAVLFLYRAAATVCETVGNRDRPDLWTGRCQTGHNSKFKFEFKKMKNSRKFLKILHGEKNLMM